MSSFKDILLISFLFFLGCGPKPYITPEGKVLAKSHNIIAILPPNIFSDDTKNSNPEFLEFGNNSESYLFQEEIYMSFLKRKAKEVADIEVQSIETTNSFLYKKKEGLYQMNVDSICNILNVDALITSQFEIEPQTPLLFRILIMLLEQGYVVDDRDIEISLSIKDCAEGSIVWNYTDIGNGVSPSRVVKSLLTKATKRMPYFMEEK